MKNSNINSTTKGTTRCSKQQGQAATPLAQKMKRLSTGTEATCRMNSEMTGDSFFGATHDDSTQDNIQKKVNRDSFLKTRREVHVMEPNADDNGSDSSSFGTCSDSDIHIDDDDYEEDGFNYQTSYMKSSLNITTTDNDESTGSSGYGQEFIFSMYDYGRDKYVHNCDSDDEDEDDDDDVEKRRSKVLEKMFDRESSKNSLLPKMQSVRMTASMRSMRAFM